MEYSQRLVYIEDKTIVKNIFTQTENKTITNTTQETSIFGSGVGSLTLPINFFTEGKSLSFTALGIVSALNGTESTIKVKIGGVELISSTSSYPSAATNVAFKIDLHLTYRNGNLIGQGNTTFFAGQEFGTSTSRPLQMLAPVAITNAQENLIDITYKWTTASASNSLIFTNAIINSIN